ncbi:MAG: hypothetical protein L6R36_008291 [Xanthoria steineri]|nr:MAG: hypothetical protein L6R36_008291 [Xanthoria steineri]
MSQFPERQYCPPQDVWHQQEDLPAGTWRANTGQPELAYIDWTAANLAFDVGQHDAEHPELPGTSEDTLPQDTGFNPIAYEAQSSDDRLPAEDIFQQEFTFDQYENQPEEPCSIQAPENLLAAETDMLLQRIAALEARIHEQENQIKSLSE